MESLKKSDMDKIKQEQQKQQGRQAPPWEPTKIFKFDWNGKIYLTTYQLKDVQEMTLERVNSEMNTLATLKKELEQKK